MVVFVGFRVDVEGQRQLPVSVQASTFVIATQAFLAVPFARLGSVALQFLL